MISLIHLVQVHVVRLPHETDIGLTVQTDQGLLSRVTNVVEGGAAYRAGIRQSTQMFWLWHINENLTPI